MVGPHLAWLAWLAVKDGLVWLYVVLAGPGRIQNMGINFHV
jgi:hypothetical protein